MTLAVAGMTCVASAQNLNSAYFLDGYAYGHELNPAKNYEREGYFSIPDMLGNVNLGQRGNMALTNFLYITPNGKLGTYLHPSVSYEEATKNLNKINKAIIDARYDIFSLGFHAKKSFHTIGLSLRANAGLNVPFELFDITKRIQNKNYDISNMGITAKIWAEIGYGYSRNVGKAWRIGAKTKMLIGMGFAGLDMQDVHLNLSSSDRWTATAHATAEVGLKGFSWGKPMTKAYSNAYMNNHPNSPTRYEQINFNNIEYNKARTNGMGLAFDIGAEWDLERQDICKGLKVSASVLDIGFIHWKNVSLAKNNGEEFVFDGFNNVRATGDDGIEIKELSDDLLDRLSNLYSVRDAGKCSKSNSLGATLNIGLQYSMPFYDKLRLGLLSSTHMQDKDSWNEERLSLNLSPLKWLEGGASIAYGTFGFSAGWVINIHTKGFSIFAGGDNYLGKLSKQGIPLSNQYNIALGINFPFGRKQ